MVNDYIVTVPITYTSGYTTYTNTVTFNLQGDNRAIKVGNATVNFGISSIQAVRESKSSGLTSIIMPFKDSDENLSWDYLGVKREFTVDATVTGTADDITRLCWLFNRILNGHQYDKTITITYRYGRNFNPTTNSFTNKSYSIIFKDFIINYEKSSEGRLNYTISFEEGKRD